LSKKSDELLIGAHTSAAGGVHNALLEGKRIGATTIQLFTSNQKQWRGRRFTQDQLDLWFETLKETGLQKVMSHDSYLINLGASSPDVLEKSRKAFREEIDRCVALKLTYLNFHPGAAVADTTENCLDRIVESLLEVEDALEGSDLKLLLESTAGQGTVVGRSFEELGYILDRVKDRISIGVCIDTCHIFVAGYDLRTAEACDAALKELDSVIGLKHLDAFHLNDSKKGLATRTDRHANLGEGEIGMDCFQFLMTDKRTKHIPKYLETPDGVKRWEEEIRILREFAKG
jgi:deoxyribonuclease IV